MMNLARLAVPLLMLSGTAWLQAAEPSVRATDTAIRFGDGRTELVFDKATGRWTGLVDAASGLRVMTTEPGAADVELYVKDGWRPTDATTPAYKSHRVLRSGPAPTLEIAATAGAWRIVSRFALHADGTIVRTVEFVYDGPAVKGLVKVRVPRFWLRALQIGDPGETTYSMLAQYPPEAKRLSELREGRRRCPRSSRATARAVLVRNAKRDLNVVTAFYSEDEWAQLFVHEKPNAIDVCHEQYVHERLRPGVRVPAGSQCVRIVHGSETAALQAVQDFYKRLGVGKPVHSPADAPRVVMYSAHPGGTIDSYFRDVGGFRNFTKLIPRIHDLGANCIWLMPFWYKHVYAPSDYFRLDPRQGEPEDLKALTDAAHKLDMRVLGDQIPHGPRPESNLDKQHPDWICRNEQGEMKLWWGCFYCDYAHPGWQQYMAKHAAYWVEHCGLDGYRVDVAGGGAPNWRPYGTNRPSQSGIWGGLRLMDASRRAVAKVNPNSIWLAESHGTHWYAYAEYAYDWAFMGVAADQALRQSPADWCRGALRYLHFQRYAFPEHAYPLRFLTNHDQVRARLRYGVGLHRAMLAMCAFVKGIPFLYHEQEIGDEDYIRRLYALRTAYDELIVGEPHYLAIKAKPGGVMAFARKLESRTSVVAINFTNQPVEAELRVPAKLVGIGAKGRIGLFEAFRGQRRRSPGGVDGWTAADLGEVRVSLGPYEPAVIVARPLDQMPADEPKPKAPAQPKDAPPRAARAGQRVTVANSHFTATIDAARGGLLANLTLPGGEKLLREVSLREQRRKLFIGADPVDVSKTRATLTVDDRTAGRVVVRAAGQVAGAGGRPILEYVQTYEASARPTLRWTCTLTALADVGPAKSDLALRLRFEPTSHWFARTVEGPLLGRCILRHPFRQTFVGRYWHGSGEAFYQSGLHPLHPTEPAFGVFDAPGAAVLSVRGPWRTDGEARRACAVRLVEDKEADSPRELGGPAAATAAIPITGARGTLELASGQKLVLEADLDVSCSTQPALWSRLQRIVPTPGLSTHGPNYILTGQHMRAVACRSAGGALRSIAWGDGPSLVTASRFYTDYGLYGNWRDPGGNEHKMSAHNSQDPEPDTLVRVGDKGARVSFTSFFRHPQAGGRSLLSPRMQYHVAYQAMGDDRLRVESAVRPMMIKMKAKAFLGQTISMVGVDQWRVDGGAWRSLGKGDRVWESAKAGRLPKSLAVRDTKSGRSIRFADFASDGGVQNVFLHASPTRATLFVAFYDGDVADVRPAWRKASFVIERGDRQ